MAKGAYIGVSNVSKKIKKMYIGVGGVAKKVKKAYIGVGGVAKLFWSGGPTAATILGSCYYLAQSTPLPMLRGVGDMPSSFSSITDPFGSTANSNMYKWILYDKANERFVLINATLPLVSDSWVTAVYTMPVDGTTWTNCGTTGAQRFYTKPWIDDEGKLYTIARKATNSSSSAEIRVDIATITSSGISHSQKSIFTDYDGTYQYPYSFKKVGDYYCTMAANGNQKEFRTFYTTDYSGTWSVINLSTSLWPSNRGEWISADTNYELPLYYINGKYIFAMTSAGSSNSNSAYTYINKSSDFIVNRYPFYIDSSSRVASIDMGPSKYDSTGFRMEYMCGPYFYQNKLIFTQGYQSSSNKGRTGYIDLTQDTPSLTLLSSTKGISIGKTGTTETGRDYDYTDSKLVIIGYEVGNANARRLCYSTDLYTWTLASPTNIEKLRYVACSKST